VNSQWVPRHTVPYRRGFALRIPRRAGLYVIHDFRGALYAGRSTALRRRFDEHLEEQYNPLLRSALQDARGPLLFSWSLVSLEDLDVAERAVIELLRPPCNRTI
jgi:predicted GIY-YIG superfamily endonuclease